MKLSKDEEILVGLIVSQYNVIPSPPDLPLVVGICEHRGLNLVNYKIYGLQYGYCLSKLAYCIIIGKIVEFRRSHT